ncbi:hypothetical protein STEG23_038369 [Scotinomys teguina]
MGIPKDGLQNLANTLVGDKDLNSPRELSAEAEKELAIVEKTIREVHVDCVNPELKCILVILPSRHSPTGILMQREDVILEWIFLPRKPNKKLKTYIEKISDLIHKGAASHPGKKRTQEQPVTLRGRGPRSSQSPLENDPQPLPETLEQPVTLRGRGPRSTQTPLEQETSPAPSSKAEMGRHQCKSTYNNIKNKASPESSPPPTPRPENCNADKAEENDLKNSLMKMIEEALEGKMKNAIKEIEEKTNKKLKENNEEIEEKNKK